MTEQIEEKVVKKRGCFHYLGCFVSICILLGLAGFGWISYAAFTNFTDAKPLSFNYEVTEEQQNSTQQKIAEFQETIESGKEVTLKLHSSDLNVIIENNEELKDRLYMEIENGRVKGQLSWPFESSFFGKRYINGTAVFNCSLENGVLIITLESLEGKKRALPEALMEQIRQQNLAKDLYKDPEKAKAIRRVKKIEIKDDYVLITPNLEGE
ncbi:hypothetical protein [Candidatus Uabimicrobium sp. HlEnr_7]|uniref:hypothetical protein n=1 Tax=Candidatus Uabimicrobium helgolandensis TaxID=3095367 RepID=UPI00355732C5